MKSANVGPPVFEPAVHLLGQGTDADLHDRSGLQIGLRHTSSQAEYQSSKLENGILETVTPNLAIVQWWRLVDSHESDSELQILESELWSRTPSANISEPIHVHDVPYPPTSCSMFRFRFHAGRV